MWKSKLSGGIFLERIEAKILRELATSKKTFWELLEKIDSPLNNFLIALEKLRKGGFITADGEGFHITERGKTKINPRALEFEGKICPSCLGKRIIPEGKFKEVLESFKKIVGKRPSPLLNFFQGYMLERDVIARTALMHYYGDLEGKDVVLIGDDDLLSVALALTGLPSSIVVLDVDRRLGDFLRSVKKNYGLNIKFFEHDVSKPIPKGLQEKFDVFSSEPLETISGLKAFLLRGLVCLKENGVGYFGLTNYEASLKKWLKVQELLVKMNCVVTDIIQGFSVYPMKYETVDYEEFANKLNFEVGKNPGINWYKSALIRFEVIEKNLPETAFKEMKS
jgi:predicted methyltransferase